MIIDLHSHTTASDGVLSPEELIQLAEKHGVSILAVTDHDTVDGHLRAREAATSVEVIGGIEISCFHADTEIHVLGLGIDAAGVPLREWLTTLMERRVDRFHGMIAAMADLGIKLDGDAILAEAGDGSVGRPHIARVLMAEGHVQSLDEAFNKYLNRGQPGYVERFQLDVAEAITRVHEAGGVAVQAHPGAMGVDSNIPALVELGLDGLEVHHPDHDAATQERLAYIAKELGLLTTGGSDYHGDAAGRSRHVGQETTSQPAYVALLERRKRYQ